MLDYDESGLAFASISGNEPPSPATIDRDSTPPCCLTSIGISYPSPPMSRPPSPGQEETRDLSRTSATVEAASITALSAPATSAITSGATHTEAFPAYNPQIFIQPSFTASPASTYRAQQPQLLVSTQQSTYTRVPQTGAVGFAVQPEASSSARPLRKVKAHVASACINCKRAHLSCDVQRPCRRCVDSGREVRSREK